MKRKFYFLDIALLLILIFFFILLKIMPISELFIHTTLEKFKSLFKVSLFSESINNSFLFGLYSVLLCISISVSVSYLIMKSASSKLKRNIVFWNTNILKNILFLFVSFSFSSIFISEGGILSKLFNYNSMWPVIITTIWTTTPYMIFKLSAAMINIQIRYLEIFKTSKVSFRIKLK